ncbi:MAG: hypothetical protein M3Y87_03525 [Myxococcota bacterium]|nr:hypothetical protein [Myxococcota bacterium]
MTWRSIFGAALLVTTPTLVACSESNPSTPDAAVAFDGELPLGEVTYHGDVRPILAEHCVGCHVEGGIGPFPLDTYETTAPIATRIAQVTRDRIMPPYLADASGDCQSFDDPQWLTDRELDTLAAWDEQGEPLGDPATPAPVAPTLPTLDGELTTIDIGIDYAADTTGPDDYRCFMVEAPFADEYFLTGHEVHPGNRATVHHVIVFSPFDDEATTQAREYDAADPEPGYTCFGAPGVDAFPVVLWAPGAGATNYPAGTGIRMAGGAPLIVQVHYNTLAGNGTDRTSVDLETATSVPRAARIIPVADFDLALAPRMSSVETTDTWDLSLFTRGAALPLTIYGTFPHMHTLGRTLRVEHIRESDSAEQCLVDVPRWDFNWQLAYFYERPLTISTLDSIRITCGYDTSSRSDMVTWGEGTQDEMCLNFFYVVIAGGL